MTASPDRLSELASLLAAGTVVLDALPIALYFCDAKGAALGCNRRAAALLGRQPEVGERDWWLGPALGEVLQTEAPVEGREIALVRRNGSRLMLLADLAPLRDATGALEGAVVAFRDVTRRTEAARRLEDDDSFLKAIFDATPECVKVVAADGTLLQINPAGLAMVEAPDPASVVGHPILDLIAPEHREDWRAHHARVCEGESLSWEFDIIGLRGRRRQMATHAVPLRGPDGLRSQLAVTRDVSARKRS